VKSIIRPGDWKIDLLGFRPALIKPGIFDDGIDSSQALWGAWASRPIKKRSFWRQAEVYYLGLDRKQARFEQGTARELRHTVGMLLHAQQGAFSMFTERPTFSSEVSALITSGPGSMPRICHGLSGTARCALR
jgi:hypothetical protein